MKTLILTYNQYFLEYKFLKTVATELLYRLLLKLFILLNYLLILLLMFLHKKKFKIQYGKISIFLGIANRKQMQSV